MTKLQIMNEIAYVSNDPLFTFSVCKRFAEVNKKNDLLKVLDLYHVVSSDKIYFYDICCYWLDDNYIRHYIFNRCPYGKMLFPIEEVPHVQ